MQHDRRQAPRSRRRRGGWRRPSSTARRSRPSSTPSPLAAKSERDLVHRQRQHDRPDLHELPGGAAPVRGRGQVGAGRGRPARARQGGPARGARATCSSRCSPPPRRPRARSATTSPGGIGVAGPDPPASSRARRAQSAPAFALRNLVVAERQPDRRARRCSCSRRRSPSATSPPSAPARAAARYRARLPARTWTSTSSRRPRTAEDGIFKTLMERYKEALVGPHRRPHRDRPRLAGRARPHHRAATGASSRGSCCRSTAAGSPSTPAPRPPRRWEPAELAICEALFDARGTSRATSTQREGRRRSSTSSSERLRADGLPHTHVLTGD